MMDRIELRGLRAVGVHGVNPEEQDRPQPWEVDLDLELDLSVAGRSDALSDTVDYGAVSVAVAQIISTERHQLLEKLAHRIAESLLADPKIAGVGVNIRKVRPPVPVDLATSGVAIHRSRPLTS